VVNPNKPSQRGIYPPHNEPQSPWFIEFTMVYLKNTSWTTNTVMIILSFQNNVKLCLLLNCVFYLLKSICCIMISSKCCIPPIPPLCFFLIATVTENHHLLKRYFDNELSDDHGFAEPKNETWSLHRSIPLKYRGFPIPPTFRWFLVHMLVNIPAPWFAYGIGKSQWKNCQLSSVQNLLGLVWDSFLDYNMNYNPHFLLGSG
jgi:hypothetical protein